MQTNRLNGEVTVTCTADEINVIAAALRAAGNADMADVLVGDVAAPVPPPTNMVIHSYDSYNHRRYSDWWVAAVDANGKFDFAANIGGVTSRRASGDAGDVYLYAPEEGQVYAYGQKDYRQPKNTEINFVKTINGAAVDCDKLGRTE